MSKELSDRLEHLHDHLRFNANESGVQLLAEVIGLLRAEPLGYAVQMDTGNFVGIWREKEIAESVCAKQPTSHGDKVIAVYAAQREAIAALRSEPVATVRRKEDDSLEFTPLCDFYVVNGMKLYAAPSRETAKVVPVHSKSQYKRVAAQGGNPVLSRETAKPKTKDFGYRYNANGLVEKPEAEPVREDQRSEAEQESKGSGSPLIAPAQSSDHPTAEPALSAEQIAQWRQRMNDLQAIGVAMPPGSNVLADMALSSLTARDEGIEAAAKHVEGFNRGMAVVIRKLKGASHD